MGRGVFLPLALLLSCFLATPVNAVDKQVVTTAIAPQFIKLLTYEIQNRAFALNSVGRFIEDRADEPDEKVWRSYFALEQLNRRKYRPVAEKFGIPQDATLITDARTWIGGVFFGLFPETATRIIRGATVSYVEKLEELERLAGSEDKEFFRYVVMQEKAQADALALLANGEAERAAAVIDAVVVKFGD